MPTEAHHSTTLLHEYFRLEAEARRYDIEIDRHETAVRVLENKVLSLTDRQMEITAELAPRLRALHDSGKSIYWREGYGEEYAVSYDEDSDLLTLTPLGASYELDRVDPSPDPSVVLKALSEEDTGDYETIADDLSVIDQEAC